MEVFAMALKLALANFLLWLAFDWYGWKILEKNKFLNEYLIQRVDLNGIWLAKMAK